MSKKRKGVGFATSDYIDPKVTRLIIDILSRHYCDLSNAKVDYIKSRKELSVWADPLGISFYTGHGKMGRPVPWAELGVTFDERCVILMEFSRISEKMVLENLDKKSIIPKSSFKVIITHEDLGSLVNMMEL